MKPHGQYGFYGVVALYSIYNMSWLLGTSFSWGRNDGWREAAYILLTFTADIPALFLAARKPRLGLPLFLLLLIGSFSLGALNKVINYFTLLYWYAPKLLPTGSGIWINTSNRKPA